MNSTPSPDLDRLAAGLSGTMRRALDKICDDPDGKSVWWGWGSGCTNPTGNALQKRGLATCEFDRTKSIVGFPWSRWKATDLGHALRNHLTNGASNG